MEFDAWLEKFGILRDGDYLGFSEELPDPEEFLPMLFDIELPRDSEFIWDNMNIDHSFVWSMFLESDIHIISNGFEPDAVGYYIGTKICKRKALKVRIKA